MQRELVLPTGEDIATIFHRNLPMDEVPRYYYELGIEITADRMKHGAGPSEPPLIQEFHGDMHAPLHHLIRAIHSHTEVESMRSALRDASSALMEFKRSSNAVQGSVVKFGSQVGINKVVRTLHDFAETLDKQNTDSSAYFIRVTRQALNPSA